MRLLLIEDNERLLALIRSALARAGYAADGFTTAMDAEAALRSVEYSLMILDLGLPDEDGLALLKRLRLMGNSLPILILTARGGIEERVRGLDAGADDYMVKPFANEELIARVRVLLRRPGGLVGDVLELGALRLDVASHQVSVRERTCFLSPREVAVLEILLRRSGRVVNKKLVEDHLFGLSGDVGSNAVEVHVHRLRKMLSDAGATVRIHTVRGVGYLMAEEKAAG
jgi:DNA-binding response OmpR family regulator